jgi:hypothetical protein
VRRFGAGERLEVCHELQRNSPTTIRTKVLKVGEAEPASWTLTTTDSTAALQAAGSVGMYLNVSSSATAAPVVVSADDFRVRQP